MKPASILAFLLFLCAMVAVPAQAQTVVNPRTVEFDPSADHSTLTADNQPLVQRYDLQIYLLGASQPFTTASLGKPAAQADGKIRVDFSTLVAPFPLADGSYQARVAAIGPTGNASSDPSNTFAFQSQSCTITLGSPSQAFAAGGGTGSVTVNAGTGCAWTATSSATWVTVGTPSGSGAGVVNFTVLSNLGTARAASLTIGGQTFSITQGAAAACSYSLSQTSLTFTEAGGGGTVMVATGSACGWSASEALSWLTLNTTSGTGPGAASFSVAANTGTTSRTGTITIAGQAVTITQSAPVPCTYSISPTSQSFAADGGTVTVAVTAGNGCSWTAAGGAAWATLTGTGGTGSGGVTVSVGANGATTARTTALTIAARSFTVTQAGIPCSYALSSSSQSFSEAGGNGSITLTSSGGCAWTAASNAGWVTVATTSGSGSGTVSFSVAANTEASARTATITAGGQAFSVTQAAAPCAYTLSSTSQSVGPGGGAGSVTVGTASGCTWTASSSATWVTMNTAGGTGGSVAAFSVAANPVASPRSATLMIAGQPFAVTQAAAACTYGLSSPGQSFTDTGGAGSVSVTATAGCAWTASSNAAWVRVGTPSGAVVPFTVEANTTTSPRSASLSIAGQVFTVSQAAMACSYAVTPPSQSFPETGGNGAVNVDAPAGCGWTASSNAAWVTVQSAGGSGSAGVPFTVAANTTLAARNAAVTVGGKSITVTQAAGACTYALSAAISQQFPQQGGTGSVSVNCGTGCAWTAVSSDTTWVTVTTPSGSGTGAVSYKVAKNGNPTARTTTITVGGKTYTVKQDAANRPTPPKKVRVTSIIGG